MQNAGDADNVREPTISAIYDNESEIDGQSYGPYVGTGTSRFSGHLEHLQTVHIRWVQFKTPVDHKLTEIILDPNNGGAKLRYTVREKNVEELPNVTSAS